MDTDTALGRHKRTTSFLTFCAASIIIGCSSSTSPNLLPAKGDYVLEQVDGQNLPIPIESGDCPREIFQGELSLSAGSVDQRPLYDVLVSLRLQCDPNRLLLIDQRRFVEDFGEWTIVSQRVEFRSSKGFGTQLVSIEGLPATSILRLSLGGKVYTFRRNSQ
ncbi:MAG: hypothetical protein Q7S20_08975 [Gemmatimonadaceae bacterium]|nr:hypothetical protein [Gemmatimonadaceae bacterium]